MHEARRRGFVLAGCLAVLCSAGSSVPAVGEDPALRMRAFAVNLSGGRAKTETLQIVVERWSTDEERKKLIGALVEQGGEKLIDLVQDIKPRAGYIRTSTSLGWDIQYAREHPLPSGERRIVFATDRPMGFREVRNSSRSEEYEFMVCEIRLGADGKGEGKLAGATKISYDREKQQIQLENYGQQPTRLTNVAVEK